MIDQSKKNKSLDKKLEASEPGHPRDLTVRSQDKKDKKIDQFIDSLYSNNSPNNQTQDATEKVVTDYNGTHASIFEIEFEGIPAANKTKLQTGNNLSSRFTEKDGYSSRA
jgi:hypothetical protein